MSTRNTFKWIDNIKNESIDRINDLHIVTNAQKSGFAVGNFNKDVIVSVTYVLLKFQQVDIRV